MTKRKQKVGSPDKPRQRQVKRSPQDVYDYWTEEMMAAAEPVELERMPRAEGEWEEDDGERSGS